MGLGGSPQDGAPAARTPEGLTLGIQIVASHLEERTAFGWPGRLAGEIGGFEAPAGFDRDDELR